METTTVIFWYKSFIPKSGLPVNFYLLGSFFISSFSLIFRVYQAKKLEAYLGTCQTSLKKAPTA